MATFPELEPATRSYDFGQFPLTEESPASSGSVRFKHGDTSQNYQLTLGYTALTDSEAALIRQHFQSQGGGYRSFQLPSIIWAGHTFSGNVVPYSTRWRYIETPEEEHFSVGYVNVTVTLGSDGTNEDAILASAVEISFTGGAGSTTDSLNLGCNLFVVASLVGGAPYGDIILAEDLLINKVTTILHFNGTNGSTVKTDSSYYANTVVDDSPGADSIISTAQSKFGGASLYMDGTTSLIIDNPAINIGSNEDHTVEFWFYPTSTTPGDRALLSIRGSDTSSPSIDLIAYPDPNFTIIGLQVCSSVVGKSFVFSNAGGAALNADNNIWNHIAYSRLGTAYTFFVNGHKMFTLSNVFPVSAGRILRIGTAVKLSTAFDPSLPLIVDNLSPAVGYMDDLRITKGAGRYAPADVGTFSFTPPNFQHPDP
mgnify:CR=1 FL=1